MIPAYVLTWRSLQMRSPAFWYFSTRNLAEQAAKKLQSTTQWHVTAALVPEAQQGCIDKGIDPRATP